ncbi:asparagine synthase (glutamine-hydrolyzing) [Allosphingosinicella deserti]|uniref:asparagine synthase (glutamine-hydrolyzing) n=1 Tax=Allosphingosinicella deserti TaxID=2116704 RepID=A0A2P7QER6_9SPHN|nr:asparagine synthase (glutamine-hydrolyzing) [Sphingomonas deserti]PSJ36460.1 asparagine synthase (glutamine-hydrolyzing) [Sphingomonas deserti]
MCGIAGWYRRGGRPVAPEIVARQCDTIVHRGPNDFGTLVDGDFGFGMRRLSIIDIAGGHQPIASPDRRYAVVFNGEIYNHLELRAELEEAGMRFVTNSDTETLLAAFVHWQDDAWPRLDGMYAVAIWDRLTRNLTLARDPLGIKPLFVTEQQGGIAFASEIRALRPLPGHVFDVDERAVHDFFGYGHVQRPRTIFRQVRSLPPGHCLRIGPDRDAQIHAFWKPEFRIRTDVTEQEWIEETRSRLRASVKRHMLADVPVGSFLSGGVDSAAVTAIMAELSGAPIKAFTVGFPNTSIDETAAATRIARHLGCEHILLPLEPDAAGTLLPAVQAAFDEPCAATSAIPHWHLSKLAAQHLKVVLCGEGSDEIFAGYKRQRTALNAARWAPLLKALGPIAGMVDRLPATSSRRWNYLRQNARRFRHAATLDGNVQRFFAGTQISSPWLRARLFEPGFLARHETAGDVAALADAHFPGSGLATLDPLQQFMLADLTVHMPASLLNRLDQTSMAHSLEARVPFLSHGLVDWTMTMPNAMKLRGRTGKYALRKAVEPWLPTGSLGLRKLGFQLPFAEWFRGDFSQFAREAWHESGARASGLLDPEGVGTLFAEHSAGTANHGRMLYAIAMFGCWWEQQRQQESPTAAAA